MEVVAVVEVVVEPPAELLEGPSREEVPVAVVVVLGTQPVGPSKEAAAVERVEVVVGLAMTVAVELGAGLPRQVGVVVLTVEAGCWRPAVSS